MRYLVWILTGLIIGLSGTQVNAEQIRVIVAPVNEPTEVSSFSIYPNTSEFIANDVINELNKNLRFNVLDVSSTEQLLMSHKLYEDYRDFLKHYRNTGAIDQKLCGALYKELGIDKILLVSSYFSMQDMVLKRPILYKIGITEFEAIKSFYTLHVHTAMVDTQTFVIDFKENYKKRMNIDNFDGTTNALNDNSKVTNKLKKFSDLTSKSIAENVFSQAGSSSYSRVRSNIVSTTNVKNDSRDGNMTRDGHSYSTNNSYLKNKRIESFKNWVKERVDF